jgi:hypothetical protein
MVYYHSTYVTLVVHIMYMHPYLTLWYHTSIIYCMTWDVIQIFNVWLKYPLYMHVHIYLIPSRNPRIRVAGKWTFPMPEIPFPGNSSRLGVNSRYNTILQVLPSSAVHWWITMMTFCCHCQLSWMTGWIWHCSQHCHATTNKRKRGCECKARKTDLSHFLLFVMVDFF